MTTPNKIPRTSFSQVMADMQAKAQRMAEIHKTNGGMCQLCGKNKAEYPDGFDPYHCHTCNEETLKIVRQLSGQPGFMAMTFHLPGATGPGIDPSVDTSPIKKEVE